VRVAVAVVTVFDPVTAAAMLDILIHFVGVELLAVDEVRQLLRYGRVVGDGFFELACGALFVGLRFPVWLVVIHGSGLLRFADLSGVAVGFGLAWQTGRGSAPVLVVAQAVDPAGGALSIAPGSAIHLRVLCA
jgi:hypothetical protein